MTRLVAFLKFFGIPILFGILLILSLVVAPAMAFSQAYVPVSGQHVGDNNNVPLTGTMVFTVTDTSDVPVTYAPQGGSPTSATITVNVVQGVVQGSGGFPPQIPNPATMSPANTRYRIRFVNSGAVTVYTLPLTPVSSTGWSYDGYLVPSTVTYTGLGRPEMPCQPGAQYSPTDISLPYNFVCSQLRSTQVITWTLNPSYGQFLCQMGGQAYASPFTASGYVNPVSGPGYPITASPFCVDTTEAWATAGMILGISGTSPGPFTSIPSDSGVLTPVAPVASRYFTGVDGSGNFIRAQPAFTDIAGFLASTQLPAFTGDATSSAGSSVLTLATVNSNVGTCGDATHVPRVTLNAKGLATGCTPVTITTTPVTPAGPTSHQWLNSVNSSGVFTTTQPAFSDLLGSPTASQIAGAGLLSNSTSGNAGTATAFAATPAQCTSGQVATGITALGAANCTSAVANVFAATHGIVYNTGTATSMNATAGQIGSVLGTAVGCTIAGYAYSPQSNTCIPVGGGGGSGITGQTVTCALQASSATTSATSFPVCDDGTTTAFQHPVHIDPLSGIGGYLGLKAGTAPAIIASTVGLIAPTTVTTAYNIAVPGAPPSAANQVPQCTDDGFGHTSCIWGTAGGVPGGSNTQIQRNCSGAFCGDANFTWNTSTGLILGKAITQTKTAALNDLYLGDGTPVFGSFPTLWAMQASPAINSPLAGLEVGIYPAAGANSTTNHIVGFAGVAWPSDNFNYHVIHGVGGDAENPGSGTIDSTEGVVGTSFLTGSGTTTSAVGVDGLVDNFGTGLITNGYALYASRATSGRFTNLYGMYIEPQTIGTALNYNLYSAGATTHNMVEGDLKVGFGSTPSDVCTQAVPCGGGGGSTSNPTTCTTSGPGVICLGLAPYYASGLGATATTTVGTTAPGTSVTLTSATSFAANQGIAIAGAGAAAGLYIGKITGLSGAVATITPATSTSVGAGAVVQHDETAALTAAIAAIGTATRGDIYFPCGTMLMNGPLQDTSHADSIILMPSIQSYSADPTIIGLHGCQPPNSTGAYTSLNSTTIKTSINSGSIIGGYNGLGIYAPLTNVWITTDNLHFILPDNPGIVAVNAHNILQLQANHIWCETTGTTRSNTAGACIFYPTLSNQVANTGDDLTAINMYTGFIIGEHTRIGSMYGSGLTKGFVFDTGTNVSIPSDESNGIAVGYLWCGSCTVPIATGSVGATVNIQMASIESPASYCVDDPSNLLTGQINYKMNTIAGSGLCTFNGAANVQTNNLLFPSATVGGMAGGVNFYTLGTHTADTTIAHDGAGSITVQGSGSLGYIQRVYNPSGPATFFTTTGSTSTTAYAALNVGGTAAGFPNWLQLLYIPSTASGIGGVYQPNTGIIRTDTGATNGLLLDAGATGSTVRMATQDVVRGTWSAAGLALPAGEAVSIGGDTSISRPLAGALAIGGESTTAGYSTKVTTASSSAIMQIHTSCTAAGCYDAQSIGDFPNWVQMFYFPSTWTGSGFTINPNSAVINVGTGASGGLVLNADATGATVKIGTESTLRATFSSSGITLPAGESYGAAILGNGMTATTQSANDNSTKVATTAYVDGTWATAGVSLASIPSITAGACVGWGAGVMPGANAASVYAVNWVADTTAHFNTTAGLTLSVGYDSSTGGTAGFICNVTASTWTNPGGLTLNVGRTH